MNAQEAREAASRNNTAEQESALLDALSKIRYRATHGHFDATLFPHLIEFTKTQLEGLGYTVKVTNNGNQMDGPQLDVSW